MKFKENVEIHTDDFWYDLFDGGYIKPENYLEYSQDVEDVLAAIKVLEDFYNSAQDQEIIIEA